MSEADATARSPAPRTRDSLTADVRPLGLEAGMTVLVHSSLSSLGWVNGGPVAVVQALMDVITADGTIVMPSHAGLSGPAVWENPPVPESWWQVIRDTMPLTLLCVGSPARRNRAVYPATELPSAR